MVRAATERDPSLGVSAYERDYVEHWYQHSSVASGPSPWKHPVAFIARDRCRTHGWALTDRVAASPFRLMHSKWAVIVSEIQQAIE